MRQSGLAVLTAAVVIALSLPIWCRPADAAQPPPVTQAETADSPSGRASTRELERRYRRGRELIAEENFTDAVRVLQSILESDEDNFFSPDAQDQGREQSLKFETQSLLGQMPAAGRSTYEKQFGPAARKLLDEALALYDNEQIGLVTRRFFHTQAGYEATYRLASDYLDHGQPLTAAQGFERLRQNEHADDQFEPALSVKTALAWQRAGRDDRAIEVLGALRRKTRRGTISMGGREIPLFDDPDKALPWLVMAAGARPDIGASDDEWIMPRGDVRRNAISSGGSPYLNRGWRTATLEGSTSSPENDSTVARLLAERQRSAASDDDALEPMLPGLQPLVVDRLVIAKSIGDLRAFDLASGRLVWATSEKDQFLHEVMRTGGGPQAQVPGTSPLSMLVAQRAWGDATFGTISSDGEQVFNIEDLGLGGPYPFPMPRLQTNRDYNRLVAYDARTGKALWEVGGPRGDGADELAGNYFLGAPLVLDRRLYCLVESGSEVRLVVLDPRTGSLEWSQTLNDDSGNLWDQLRRRSGLSPSFDGGILVCPTGSDQATAVDLIGRSLLWRYRFRNRSEVYDPRPQQLMARQQQMIARIQSGGGLDQNTWLDAAAIIADARVLFTPRDGGELHCVNLLDGSPAWKKPRGEGLFVATVRGGRVIVVGRSFVQALRLADGMPVWPEPATIPVPSGRGFAAGDHYYLPLSTAEVATIDLRDGRIVSRSRSLGDRVPGNLVGLRGHVISQGADFVETFKQLETLEAEIAGTLAANPDDAGALALRGEIRLQRGSVREAYADLQKALELKSDDAAIREMLVGSLLEGLRVDFPTYRGLPVDFEKLLADPAKRSAYLWLQAAGLQRVGETEAAFAALLRFVDTHVTDRDLERVDATLTVRRDRLVRSRAARLYEAAAPAERTRLDALWRARLEELRAGGDVRALARFAAWFGDLFDSGDLLRLAAQAPLGSDWLEDEFRLRQFEQSADRRVAAAAAARLVSLLLEADRRRDAAIQIARLEDAWPEVDALDGKTGRELAAQWKTRPEIARELAGPAVWPEGVVEPERLQNVGSPTGIRYYSVPLEGDRGPYFAHASLDLAGNLQSFVARDDQGQTLWKLALDTPLPSSNALLNRAYPRDHFMLVSTGPLIVAIDTLGTAEQPGPRVLWRMNLVDAPGGAIQPRNAGQPRRRIPFNPLADQTGTVGPVTRDSVGVIRGRKLLALDPLTGKPLWVRDGIAPGSELLGDSELFFVVPPEANYAGVNRALDGEFLGMRPLPPPPVRIDMIGRNAVLWQKTGARQALSLYDVEAEKDLWKREFEAGSFITLIEGSEAAVVEPRGALTIVSLADGQPALVAEFDSPANLQQILALRSREHYYLVCNGPLPLASMQFPPQAVLVNGDVYAFERATGRRLWQVALERHAIDPNQPSGLPVLTFHSMSAERLPNTPTNKVRSRLTCVDKRSGRIVFDERREDEPLYYVDYSADADLKQIELKLFRSTVRLTFTDKPWPETP